MQKIAIGLNLCPFPMPVVLVGAEVAGQANFFTVAWINRVNASPAIFALGVGKKHHTLTGIREQGVFSVNLPSAALVEQADLCGVASGTTIDKSRLFELFSGQTPHVPLIRECPVNVVCRLRDLIELPTNMLVLGEAIEAFSDDRFVKDGQIDVSRMDPLLLTMPDNRYHALGLPLADAWSVGKKLLRARRR